jgi:hypothetical protein
MTGCDIQNSNRFRGFPYRMPPQAKPSGSDEQKRAALRGDVESHDLTDPGGDTRILLPEEGFLVSLSADEQWVAVLAGDSRVLVWSVAQLEDYGDAAQVMEVMR